MARIKFILTQEILHRLLDYNPVTGIFVWKVYRSRGAKPGQEASAKDTDGYVTITIAGRRYFAHRLAWFYVHGVWPVEIDHQDGVVSHNWLDNLRDATHMQNLQNRKIPKNNTTGYKGVTKQKGTGRFIAQIEHAKRHMYIGIFDTAIEASEAYNRRAKELFGNFYRPLNEGVTA